jgi:CheY-like chemotaxis protein
VKGAGHSGWALVVDGDLAAARVLSRSLEALGVSCLQTRSGLLALQLTRALPLLAVVDTRLTDMSGVDLARRLVVDEGLPVVVTDASGDPGAEVRAREAGITHFALKPVSAAQLRAVVRHALSLRADHVAQVAKQAVNTGLA